MSEHVTIRVNSARLPEYIGRHVRLVCKVIRVEGDSAIVEASDGGQVEIKLLPGTSITDTYIEVIGRVEDASKIKMMVCNGMGSDLDMKIVNDTVNFIHDPKYQSLFF